MTPADLPPLIETMRLEQGHITLWPGHRARLQRSAQALGYPLDSAALDARVAQAIRQACANVVPPAPSTEPCPAQAPAWRIRLLLAADGRLAVETSPLPATPIPVRIALAQDAIAPMPGPTNALPTADTGLPALISTNAWLRHKTTHRPWFAQAQAWLQAHPGHFDLIYGNEAGELCEGSRCNVYLRDDNGPWLTPALRCGLLPGVYRQWLLDQGLAQEASLSLADLRTAPALRVSNALRGWLDARLDACTVFTQAP